MSEDAAERSKASWTIYKENKGMSQILDGGKWKKVNGEDLYASRLHIKASCNDRSRIQIAENVPLSSFAERAARTTGLRVECQLAVAFLVVLSR